MVYGILYFFIMGVYLALLIMLQSYNYAQCPQAFGNVIGSFNQLAINTGNTIGVALVVMI